MGTSAQIVELAKRSGIPNVVGSRHRPGARTKSGSISHHANDNAVDFMGYSQDDLASYFMQFETLEVFHKSLATGIWYGSSNGRLVEESTHKELVKDHENHLHVAMSPAQVGEVKTSGGLLQGLIPATNFIDPFDPLAKAVDLLRPFAVIGIWLSNARSWQRIGMGVLGSTLVIAGIVYLNRRPIAGAVGTVTRGAAGVASTAVQGAAFGAGAGAVGGIGGVTKPKSAVPSPKPPRRALPSNAPVTSPLPPEIYAPVSGGGTYTVTAVGRAKTGPRPLPNPVGDISGRSKRSKKGKQPTVNSPVRGV